MQFDNQNKPEAAPSKLVAGKQNDINSKPVEFVPVADKLLVLGSLIVGILFAVFSYINTYNASASQLEFPVFYMVFWSVFAAVMLAYAWKHSRRTKEIWFILCAVAFLMSRGFIYVDEGVDSPLVLLNVLFVIPLLLMAIPTILTYGLRKNSVSFFVSKYCKTAFCSIFKYCNRFFASIYAIFKGKSGGKARLAVLGVILGIPVFIVLMLILSKADSAMGYYVDKAFTIDSEGIFRFLFYTCQAVLMALIAYSLIYSIPHRSDRLDEAKRINVRISHITIGVIIGMMLLAYVIFAYFQFAYLTGLNGLPDELTYSEYAVRGFSELNLTAFINMSVFAISLSFCKDESGMLKRGLRWLLMGLLLATLLILASAMLRLSMYVAEYGFTLRRVLAFWFEIAILITLSIGAIKLYKFQFRAIYWGSAAIIVWYVVLNMLNLQKICDL